MLLLLSSLAYYGNASSVGDLAYLFELPNSLLFQVGYTFFNDIVIGKDRVKLANIFVILQDTVIGKDRAKLTNIALIVHDIVIGKVREKLANIFSDFT